MNYNMTKNNNNIVSFSNLVMYPMIVPNVGCIATGTLATGCDLTVTGGNVGQAADGIDTFLVEVYSQDKQQTVTKKNMARDELSLLIEHHNRSRKWKRRNRR